MDIVVRECTRCGAEDEGVGKALSASRDLFACVEVEEVYAFKVRAALFPDNVEDVFVPRFDGHDDGQVASEGREFSYLPVVGNEVDEGHEVLQIHFKDVYGPRYVIVFHRFRMELAEAAENLAVLYVFRRLAGMEGAYADGRSSAVMPMPSKTVSTMPFTS